MKPRPPMAAPIAAPAPPSNSRRVPLDKRKRTETSCDKCKSRKQKCRREAGHDACRYCAAHDIACLTTQPRKKRLYGSVEGLGNRLALLESLVAGLLPEADVSNLDELRQLGHSLGIALPDGGSGGGGGGGGGGSGSGSGGGGGRPGEARGPGSDAEDDGGDDGDGASLLPDQQGQVQYIGPASSFAFHLKLRDLLGAGVPRAFMLFGTNAAAGTATDQAAGTGAAPLPASTATATATPAAPPTSAATPPPPPPPPPTPPPPSLEALIAVYFARINPDLPVLHEPSFREAYAGWRASPESADPAWLCSFLCVLLLARRVAHGAFPADQERLWWRRVQTLLPVVIFTSSAMAIQALVLAAVHLHNTNHRDACWNLTGTAVRIAFAIGLHQDKANSRHTPTARELRRRLWWALYAHEIMQVSSYDRPGSLEHPAARMARPDARVAALPEHAPADYPHAYNRLMVLLSAACRAPKTLKTTGASMSSMAAAATTATADDAYVGPLSPAAGVLRDLGHWRAALPAHLRLDALDASPPAHARALLLLHALHHYTVYVLCRQAMLARATLLCKHARDSPNPALTAMSDACADAGRTLARILLRLDQAGTFDAITHWDCWYALAAGSILVLDLVCLDRLPGADPSDSRALLAQLAALVGRHEKNPHMPPTLAKFASIVPELQSMLGAMNESEPSLLLLSSSSSPPLQPLASSLSIVPVVTDGRPNGRGAEHEHEHEPMRPLPPQPPLPPPPPPLQPPHVLPFAAHQLTTSSGAYVFGDSLPTRYFPEPDFAAGHASFPNVRLDRNTQMNFMDFTVNNIQDWNWGDFGSFLANDGSHVLLNVHDPGPQPGPG